MDRRNTDPLPLADRVVGGHLIAVPILASSLQRRTPGYRTLGFAKT